MFKYSFRNISVESQMTLLVGHVVSIRNNAHTTDTKVNRFIKLFVRTILRIVIMGIYYTQLHYFIFCIKNFFLRKF